MSKAVQQTINAAQNPRTYPSPISSHCLASSAVLQGLPLAILLYQDTGRTQTDCAVSVTTLANTTTPIHYRHRRYASIGTKANRGKFGPACGIGMQFMKFLQSVARIIPGNQVVGHIDR